MDRGIHLCFFLFLSFALPAFGRDQGYELYVGGNDGWVTNPSESYSSWAGRLRFSVNDSLVFVYDKAVDSVLEVTSADYSSCNAASPISKLSTGRDFFKFKRSGPFYFISGNASHCQAGQKLIVVVLAVRSPPSSPAPPVFTPPSAPGSAPPGAAPAPGSTSPATAPARGSTAPGVVPTPGSTPPTMAPASGSTPPVTVPAPGSIPPGKAPAPGSTSPVTPSAPGSTPRVITPAPGSTSPPGSGGSAPSPQPAPGSGTGPQTAVSPATAPSGFSASAHLGPSSFPTVLAAAALALLGGALIQ